MTTNQTEFRIHKDRNEIIKLFHYEIINFACETNPL